MKRELFSVAMDWAVFGCLGQLMLVQFGMENWPIFFGLVIGATAQAAIYRIRE